MRLRLAALAASLAVCFLGSAGFAHDFGDDCRFEKPREATVDAQGAREVEIDARAGDLRITGQPGLHQVRVQAKACASKESLIEEIRLVAERSGDRVRVAAQIPELHGWGNITARLDLTIEVPDGVPLRVTDTSGPIDIRGVASLDLHDSSGEIRIEDVRGALSVDDSSGEIEIVKVRGPVTVADSSGEIDIRGVEGSVEIVRDSSGDIVVEGVKANVLVRHDTSGDIRVRDVEGDFTVEHDGSGEIHYTNVKGKVSIPYRHSRH